MSFLLLILFCFVVVAVPVVRGGGKDDLGIKVTGVIVDSLTR